VACGWSSPARHKAARTWLEHQSAFATSPLAELGFIRVSLTPGYRATFADAQAALANITSRKQARWVAANLRVARLPSLVPVENVGKTPAVEFR
jgi:predicted nucleic acid-binding protein